MSISVTVSASTKGRNFWLLLTVLLVVCSWSQQQIYAVLYASAPDLAGTPHDPIDLDDGSMTGGCIARRIQWVWHCSLRHQAGMSIVIRCCELTRTHSKYAPTISVSFRR